MSKTSFTSLVVASREYYEQNEEDDHGGVLHLSGACRQAVAELLPEIRASHLLDLLDEFVRSCVIGGVPMEEVVRKLLLPAVELTVRNDLGERRVQAILDQRMEKAMGGVLLPAE